MWALFFIALPANFTKQYLNNAKLAFGGDVDDLKKRPTVLSRYV